MATIDQRREQIDLDNIGGGLSYFNIGAEGFGSKKLAVSLNLYSSTAKKWIHPSFNYSYKEDYEELHNVVLEKLYQAFANFDEDIKTIMREMGFVLRRR